MALQIEERMDAQTDRAEFLGPASRATGSKMLISEELESLCLLFSFFSQNNSP